MAKRKKTTAASIEPKTIVTPAALKALGHAGDITFSPEQGVAIERALKEYEILRTAAKAGVGREVVSTLKRFEAAIAKMTREIDELKGEAGHLWEYLTYRAGVDHVKAEKRLRNLKVSSARLRRFAGMKKWDSYLRALLLQLEAIFIAAGGGSTGISRRKKERSGRFLSFSFASMNLLPNNCQPQSMNALGARWELICRARKKGKVARFKWIGGPHSSIARR